MTEYNNISFLLQRFINIYYETLKKEPKVRGDIDTHLEMANRINAKYRAALNNHYIKELIVPAENHKTLFKEQIDFLTGIYSKEKEMAIKRAAREQFKSIPNRHYKPAE